MFIILLGNIDFRMKKELWYLGFLNQNGRALSTDYQSEEKALSVEDALQAIELLSEEKTAIYGGDILAEADGELVYAHDIWGKEYYYLKRAQIICKEAMIKPKRESWKRKKWLTDWVKNVTLCWLQNIFI